jgi:phage shock protein A
MGIFKRLSQVLSANINDLLSKSEDPEKMLNQIMFELQEQYTKAKSQVTMVVAEEKRLEQKCNSEKAQADEWEQKARLAIQKGNEPLAKEALTRKNQHSQMAAEYGAQWEKQKKSSEVLKQQLQTLEMKIDEARRKKDLLIARKKRADAQKKVQEIAGSISDTSAFDTFGRMEEKVLKAEAEADAATEMAQLGTSASLDEQFKQLTSTSVDDELKKLKSDMGLLPEQGSPSNT